MVLTTLEESCPRLKNVNGKGGIDDPPPLHGVLFLSTEQDCLAPCVCCFFFFLVCTSSVLLGYLCDSGSSSLRLFLGDYGRGQTIGCTPAREIYIESRRTKKKHNLTKKRNRKDNKRTGTTHQIVSAKNMEELGIPTYRNAFLRGGTRTTNDDNNWPADSLAYSTTQTPRQ